MEENPLFFEVDELGNLYIGRTDYSSGTWFNGDEVKPVLEYILEHIDDMLFEHNKYLEKK